MSLKPAETLRRNRGIDANLTVGLLRGWCKSILGYDVYNLPDGFTGTRSSARLPRIIRPFECVFADGSAGCAGAWCDPRHLFIFLSPAARERSEEHTSELPSRVEI